MALTDDGVEVGIGFVSILPSTAGFHQQLGTEVDSAAEQAGKSGGQKVGAGISDGVRAQSPAIADAVETATVKPASEAGRKAGAGFSATFKGVAAGAVAGLLTTQALGKAVDFFTDSIRKAAKADGMEKQLAALGGAADRLQVSFGRGVIQGMGGFDKAGKSLNQTLDALTPAMQKFGEVIGDEMGDVVTIAAGFSDLATSLSDLAAAVPGGTSAFDALAQSLNPIGGIIGGASDAVDAFREKWYDVFGDPMEAATADTAEFATNMTFAKQALYEAGHQTAWIKPTATDLNAVAIAAEAAWFNTDRLSQALDEANGKNRSRAGARTALAADWLSLSSMGGKDAKGNQLPFAPTVTGGKIDRSTESGQQALQWILGLAGDVDARVKTRFDQGDVAGAQYSLEANRRRLTNLLDEWGVKRPAAFANRFLATPDYLPQAAQSSAAVERHLTGAGVDRTPQVVFTGPNYFRDEQAAARRAQEVAVLQRGSHGQIPPEALS